MDRGPHERALMVRSDDRSWLARVVVRLPDLILLVVAAVLLVALASRGRVPL